jgi:diguanylate cyclase (GGDEF)-like protein/PAS domain S-box-containing protein
MFNEFIRRYNSAPAVSRNALLAIVFLTLISIIVVQASIFLYDLTNLRRNFNSHSIEIFESVTQKFRQNEHLLNSIVILQRNTKTDQQEQLRYFVENSLKQYKQIHGFYSLDWPVKSSGASAKFRLIQTITNPRIDTAVTAKVTKSIQSILARHATLSQRSFRVIRDKESAGYYFLVHQTRLDGKTIRVSVLAIHLENLINGIRAKMPKHYSLALSHNKKNFYYYDTRRAPGSALSLSITHLDFLAQNASSIQPFNIKLDQVIRMSDLRLHWMLFGLVLCILINYMLFYIYRIKIRSAKARKRARDQIFKERERAAVTMGSVEDAVIIANYDGNIEYMNPMAESMTGLRLKKVIGKDFFRCIHFVDKTGQKSIFNPVKLNREPSDELHIAEDLYLQQADKQYTPVSGSISPIKSPQGENEGLVVVFRDIGGAKALESKLRYEATHDHLTGLYNRREFTERLDAAINKAASQSIHSVVLYLDLDHFKIVNDTCGHTVGDQLIAEVAALFESNVKITDTIARLGGDEFAILLENCSLVDAEFVAKRIIAGVKHYHFSYERKVFDVAVSIGVMEITTDTYSVSEVITRADAACYQAKDRGGNRYHIYHENDPSIQKRRGEMEWVQRIKQAMQEDRFELYIQEIRPFKKPASKPGQHFEVLLRMLDTEDNVILPMDYIMAAERYDKMVELDRWVIENAIKALYELHRVSGKSDTSFGINLSGQSINESTTIDYIKTLLKQYPGIAQNIVFEITETAAVDRFAKASRMINSIRALGCRFALDDFGTGLSSLAYLKNLPVDFIKIDGQFIRDFNYDPVSRELVYSIARIAKVMGLKIIAEYIEDETTAKKLADIGIEYGQGSWFSKPVSVKQYTSNSAMETA